MTILIFFIILTVLVLIHEAGHFIAAKKAGVKVEEFGFGFPPRLFGVKVGETLYSVNLIPLGGFVKVYGEEYHEDEKINKKDRSRAFVYKKPWAKTMIVLAGIFGNFLLAWGILTFLFTQGVPVPLNKVVVQEVQKGSPAQLAGLQKKDEVTKIIAGGKELPLTSTNELIDYSKKYSGEKIMLEVKRGSDIKRLEITPRKNPPAGQGPLGIAITTPTTIKKYSFVEAPYYGLIETVSRTKQIFVGLFQILGQLLTFQKPSAEVAGPIGIARLTGEVAKLGYQTVLEFVAILSLNLAVVNVFPFPPLDGSRLAFIIYEWTTKRRPNKKFEQYVNIAGMLILLGITILVSINDIIKLK